MSVLALIIFSGRTCQTFQVGVVKHVILHKRFWNCFNNRNQGWGDTFFFWRWTQDYFLLDWAHNKRKCNYTKNWVFGRLGLLWKQKLTLLHGNMHCWGWEYDMFTQNVNKFPFFLSYMTHCLQYVNTPFLHKQSITIKVTFFRKK